jgi:hypothetical protein
MLALSCARLALPADDPAWQLTGTAAVAVSPRRFRAPHLWAGITNDRGPFRESANAHGTELWDASGRLLLSAAASGVDIQPFAEGTHGHSVVCMAHDPRSTAELTAAATQSWLNASRRWLRRYAQIGLASLISRPAYLSITPTHVDVRFDPNRVSLAIRRAGLDLDVGWLPWFRRVVRFHYRRSGE